VCRTERRGTLSRWGKTDPRGSTITIPVPPHREAPEGANACSEGGSLGASPLGRHLGAQSGPPPRGGSHRRHPPFPGVLLQVAMRARSEPAWRLACPSFPPARRACTSTVGAGGVRAWPEVDHCVLPGQSAVGEVLGADCVAGALAEPWGYLAVQPILRHCRVVVPGRASRRRLGGVGASRWRTAACYRLAGTRTTRRRCCSSPR
jgi:hypothetical protein